MSCRLLSCLVSCALPSLVFLWLCFYECMLCWWGSCRMESFLSVPLIRMRTVTRHSLFCWSNAACQEHPSCSLMGSTSCLVCFSRGNREMERTGRRPLSRVPCRHKSNQPELSNSNSSSKQQQTTIVCTRQDRSDPPPSLCFHRLIESSTISTFV